MRRFRFSDPGFEAAFAAFIDERRETPEEVDTAVRDVLAAVRAEGLDAVLRFGRQFDRAEVDESNIRVSAEEIEAGAAECSPEVREAIAFAARRIRAYHERQRPADMAFTDEAGVELGWRWTALEAVGVYVPGGRAAYPSTVLMNAVPAAAAGVERIAMVTPPGRLQPAVLAAAKEAGVTEIWRVGGAQAIAALAYGAGPIAPVDKIVGPGNAYVTAAKRRVYGTVGIDALAGPSEFVVVADGANRPDWIAADLLSQAEHGPDSQVILLSPSTELLDQAAAEVERQCAELPRGVIARQALAQSRLIAVDSLAQAVEVSNRYAPEHLILQVASPRALLDGIDSAGSIFLGQWTPESVGDYCSGSNHVLPTYGYARSYSGVSVASYQKQISVQEVSEEGLRNIGPCTATLAAAEQLEAHRRAVTLRLATLEARS